MPDLSWNTSLWGDNYGWEEAGEEWSVAWGGSEAQWYGSLFPRLHRLLPASSILEIAPGYGRWTRFLLPNCERYLGIDLNASCVEACRNRFSNASHARFESNDGLSLAAAPDASFDVVFSFDSLVHAEIDVLQAYVPEILRKLKPGGTAFIHHSNYAQSQLVEGQNDHSRAHSVSASAVADLVSVHGGQMVVQEVVTWIDAALLDCLTMFRRPAGQAEVPAPVHLSNPYFADEARLIAHFQAPYSAI